jgi:Tn3 transposase DDE domain
LGFHWLLEPLALQAKAHLNENISYWLLEWLARAKQLINATWLQRAFRTVSSDSNAYVEDLDLSISAVLLAEACNIGLTPVIHPEIAALTRDRLSWVRHHFVRAETITRANACLVQAQRDIPLAQVWGGGYVASVDGLRFVVPVRSVNTGPNPRYFRQGRGVTYLNYTSDQFTGRGGLVIPGTIRFGLLARSPAGTRKRADSYRDHE